jgi:hypothetical protein
VFDGHREADVASDLIELAPEEPGTVRRAGYDRWSQECRRCRRTFFVYSPREPYEGGVLMRDIPCPHCHRARVEVAVQRSARPVLIVPVERAESAWFLRRVARRGRERYLIGRARLISLCFSLRRLMFPERRS